MKSNIPHLMLVNKKPEAIGLSNNHIMLDKPIISIGRKNNNDIVVKSQTLSGHHADIVVTEKGNKTIFVLKDNQSTNKSFVNDIPVKEYILQNKDLIRFGDVEFVFNSGESDEEFVTTVMLDLESRSDVDMKKTKNLDPFFEARKQKAEKLIYIFLSLLIFLGLAIIIIIVIFFFSILTSVSII